MLTVMYYGCNSRTVQFQGFVLRLPHGGWARLQKASYEVLRLQFQYCAISGFCSSITSLLVVGRPMVSYKANRSTLTASST